jgi:hypothetical protein
LPVYTQGETAMKKLVISCLALLLISAAYSTALAQTETANGVEIEKDLALLRRNLRSEKKQLIAMNIQLTDAEATKFWPLYDQYAAEMSKHYDEFYAVIKDYGANQKTLTDDQAASLIKRWSTIQLELAKTRLKHVDIINNAIPGRKAALFFQVDRRLYALMDLQVASEIPLVIQK